MQYARIKWLNNQPYSTDFNDVYFSSDNGLKESQYVYIDKNNLVERFKNVNTSTFTVIETGFGTGLNFLAIASCWLEHAPESAKLQFISIEKYPLYLADLTRAHALWSTDELTLSNKQSRFSAISQELIVQYQTLQYGCNIFSIAKDRVGLNLWACDIKEALSAINQSANAWVLDGFAPAKNQEMWTQEVFQHIARLSQPGSSFATFTSAGHVRRCLRSVGFDCTKHVGFGKKREMLNGIFAGKKPNTHVRSSEIVENNNFKNKLL